MPSDSSRPEPFAERCIATGAILMAVGVLLGAFGAHVLQAQLAPQRFASFQTGVHYHLLHALGLLLVGLVSRAVADGPRLRWSARLMLAGIVFFSGSIYLMTAGAPRWLGGVAPVGGLSFMAAWGLLAWHTLSHSLSRPGGRGPG
jgi:uncharacterized membrane protein YgdD (TMEM256/DUF423 family)